MDSEEIINIIKFLIKFTPIGHIKETIKNLKSIVDPALLDEKSIQDELSAYEEEHFKQISLNEDKIILSKFNKDEDNYYHDQTKKIKILAQPLNENIEKIVEIEEHEIPQNPIRNLLDNALTTYREKNYKSGITGTNSKKVIIKHSLNLLVINGKLY
jgi:hypothetical protein